MHLPDTNFWLALAFDIHVHHKIALEWFEQQELATNVFCRLTQQGFLCLATNPSVFREEAMTMSIAWDSYDQFLIDERVYFSEEPPGLETFWRRHTLRFNYSPKVWNDAYLAAFAEASSLIIVSFDQGFSTYKGIKTKILTS